MDNDKITSPKVLAILRRDNIGTWQAIEAINVVEGGKLFSFPTKRGVVLIIGEFQDDEWPEICQLINKSRDP